MSDTPQITAGTWVIEPTHSSVNFAVRHLGMSKVRGQFDSFSGSITISADSTAASVAASVDMGSVNTNNADRDRHLQGGDFFNADTNPQMVFTSTTATESALTGDLTVNGVTKPVTFDLEFHGVAVDGYGVTRAGFSAEGSIKRSDYGIDFNMPVGIDGVLISDKVSIELEIQAVPEG